MVECKASPSHFNFVQLRSMHDREDRLESNMCVIVEDKMVHCLNAVVLLIVWKYGNVMDLEKIA